METVRIHKESGVAILSLNRPEVFNAFNQLMSRELLTALQQVDRDGDIRAIVLTGVGKAFCSGQDLNDRSDPNLQVSLGNSVRERYNPLILQIVNLSKPIIAAVNGVAAGAGCSLALACDLRIVSNKAKFIEVFSKVGLVLDSGSSYFLPRLVGLGKAMELAMTAAPVDAEEAVRIGMANRIVPDEQLQEEAMSWARGFAGGPTRSYNLIKRSLYKGIESSIEETLEYEAYAQELAGRTDDFREGVSAFIEKRPAQFKGK
ncbi:MAG: enoyl-CoA hydratase-related protein [Bacilli bacterium]